MKINLSNLSEATEQQVFDHVANHLLNQNKRSVIESTCAYRGPNGTMCAAGCLLDNNDVDALN